MRKWQTMKDNGGNGGPKKHNRYHETREDARNTVRELKRMGYDAKLLPRQTQQA